MNPEESENEIVVNEQALEPSFGRAQPFYPLQIGKCECLVIKKDSVINDSYEKYWLLHPDLSHAVNNLI